MKRLTTRDESGYYHLRRGPNGGEINKITVVQHLGRLEDVALRPVSRERVERMWPGCEACKDAGLAIGEVQFYGTFEGHIDVTGNIHYCPNCGRPITPIAKKKQEERLEVLHDD